MISSLTGARQWENQQASCTFNILTHMSQSTATAFCLTTVVHEKNVNLIYYNEITIGLVMGFFISSACVIKLMADN